MAEGMVIVDGDDLPPDEFGAEHGWRSAAVKKNAQRVSRRDSAREAANSQGHRERLSGSRKPISLKSKIIKSSRMPQLPKEHWKIIARPRGGLDVQKTGSARLGRAVTAAAGLTSEQASQDIVCPNATQNIIVLSTASRANADAYLKMNCITLGIKKYELSTYEAAPHATCKGVIRQIDVSESQADLERSILNDRNPLALGAKRIKNSETVVVVFDGYKGVQEVWSHEPRRKPHLLTYLRPLRGPARHSGQDLQAEISTPVHRSTEKTRKKCGIQEARRVPSTDKRRWRTGYTFEQTLPLKKALETGR
ncbi:hypothetical protein MTO96_042501 [Rhipicephalus appendiculatus]